jgi:two-component system, sensor histidine kinase LadS
MDCPGLMESIMKKICFALARLHGAWLLLCCFLALSLHVPVVAQISSETGLGGEVTLQSQYWIDQGGAASIDQLLVTTPDPFQRIERHRSFNLAKGSALWLRLDLPAMDSKERWFLKLSSGTFIDQVRSFQRTASGTFKQQRAGDHLPVGQWDLPDQTPVFQVDLSRSSTVWLRLENQPAAIAPRLQLLSESSLASNRRWSFLLLGGYFGFGLLVLFIGVVHARLYGDRAFVAYSAYVAFMLLFQLSFTGIGGLYFWPHWAAWNNASPAIFMLLLTSSGIWFVREACVLKRHSRSVDNAVMAWVGFGVLFTVIYVLLTSRLTFAVLNLFGLLSVILSITLCLWVWRRGERYGGWLFLGFLPVHLGYPFPALRSAGVIADNWLSQYAVLIGSAIEIPLLLYILHKRAKESSENSARLRAIDHTDPLTGLSMAPVLTVRVRDALRRSTRRGFVQTLMLVDLSNHSEIAKADGRSAGDRALVVAASQILSVVGDLGTVSRIDDARFAVLVESAPGSTATGTLAQRIVAKGLAQPFDSLSAMPLRFRVVSAALVHQSIAPKPGQDIDLNEVLAPLVEAMEDLATTPKKAIVNLTPAVAAAGLPGRLQA